MNILYKLDKKVNNAIQSGSQLYLAKQVQTAKYTFSITDCCSKSSKQL